MTIEETAIEAARNYYRHQLDRAEDYRQKLAAIDRGSGMYDHFHSMLACHKAAINSMENMARRLGLYEEICK